MHNQVMTTSLSPLAKGPGGAAPADLYTSMTQSLLARSPGIKAIEAQLTRDSARLSSIGKLALALDQFHASATKLSGDKLNAAASASGKAVSVQLLDAKAAAGSYAVEVKQLAQGQQLATKAQPDKDAAIGTGAPTLIKVEIGSGASATSKTLRIESGNNTLEGIAKAMKDAGLDAKVVADGKGYALSLTGPTGAANPLRVSVTGDAALKNLLSYGAGAQGGMASKAGAQDAQLTIDGKAVTSATNTLSSAIPGVTITLNQAGTSEVKTTRDASATAGNLKQFVNSYNTLQAKLRELKTGEPGNDAMLARVQSQIGEALGGVDAKALAAAGITRTNDGLALDEAKLNAAIAADPAKVAQLFSAPSTGLAERLAVRVAEQMSTGGVLSNQAAAAQGSVEKLTAKKTMMTDAVLRQASMLMQQYEQAGTGGSSLFGPAGAARPMSLFDILT